MNSVNEFQLALESSEELTNCYYKVISICYVKSLGKPYSLIESVMEDVYRHITIIGASPESLISYLECVFKLPLGEELQITDELYSTLLKTQALRPKKSNKRLQREADKAALDFIKTLNNLN